MLTAAAPCHAPRPQDLLRYAPKLDQPAGALISVGLRSKIPPSSRAQALMKQAVMKPCPGIPECLGKQRPLSP